MADPRVVIALLCVSLAATSACKKRVGEPCKTDREAECASETNAMTCLGGTWRDLSCRGPKGCTTQNATVDCDQSNAAIGDSCETEGNVACAVDRKSTLRCDQTRWVAGHVCNKGCAVKDRVVECD